MLLRKIHRLIVSTCAFLAVLTGAALSEPAKTRLDADEAALIASRTDKSDGTTAMTFGRRLPLEWETKVGVDVGMAEPLPTTAPVESHLDGPWMRDRSSGAGWASIVVPAAPIGWDKAAFEARVDPAQDQGQVTTTLSKSLPLGSSGRVTVKNGYSLTETIPTSVIGATLSAPNANPAETTSATIATDNAVSLDLLPSATTLSAGAKLSTAEDRWLRSLSAEQKLFGGPVSVTGTVSERADGAYDGSLKAGFKRAW
jgi:hypothetical protein